MDLLVFVGNDTLTFNSKLSGQTEVPILRREILPTQGVIDWSKAPGQYFSMKLQRLSTALELNEDQQARIKPVLEQEAGDVSQICLNPVLSRKDKLNRFQKIVLSSDEKIKHLLSETQKQKLRVMRREQKQDVERIVAEKRITAQD